MDWLTGVILTSVLSIVLSVIGNLLTNPVKNWWGRRSARRAQARIAAIERDLFRLEQLHNSPTLRQIELLRGLVLTTVLIACGLITIAYVLLGLVAPASTPVLLLQVLATLGILCFVIATRSAWITLVDDARAADFPLGYKLKMAKVLEQLRRVATPTP